MPQWPHDDTASLIAFYGDPRDPGFVNNLVVVVPPWQMTYEGRPVAGVRVHRKLAASLKAVFDDIAAQVGRDWTRLPPGAVHFSGSYNYRAVRGSSRLSCHAFGAAIDMDAEHNPMNREHNRGTMSPLVIEAFKRQGWFWGGDFNSRQDPMHFQAANESRASVNALSSDDVPPSADAVGVDTGEGDPKPLESEPVGSPLVSSEGSQATQVAPISGDDPTQAETVAQGDQKTSPVPSMLTSKTGWAAAGLGGSGALDGIRQANEYASEVSMAKWNLSQLNAADALAWVWHHPAVLVPVVVIAAAVFVWEDHRKYKRLLHAAQEGS